MLAPPLSSSSSSPWQALLLPNLNYKYNYKYNCTTICCSYTRTQEPNSTVNTKKVPKKRNDKGEAKKKSISQIQVPRQKHIPVSKTHLLHALVSFLSSSHHHSPDSDSDSDSDSEGDSVVSNFLLLSSCLDSILHAEHKSILEDMRADYFSSQSVRNEEELPTIGQFGKEGNSNSAEGVGFTDDRGNGSVGGRKDETLELEENQMSFLNGFDLMQLFGSTFSSLQNSDDENSSTSEVATATRFQRSFMKLLKDAQFEELSVRDLMLTSALNTDYLLTLPIYVDWKKASESNAIIFRRGYGTEKEKGLLIVEKLDYLQSKALQGIFGLISKPLVPLGLWMKEFIRGAGEKENMPVWMRRIQLWVLETSLFQPPYSSMVQNSDDSTKDDQDVDKDLPIWLAAQKAVSRYEGFLASSMGPRSRLLKKFLTWAEVVPSTPEVPFEFDNESNAASEPHLRPVSLSRISLNDIWSPATSKYCGNNLWKMLKVGFSIIFSRSVLQEPAFHELILLYTEETGDTKVTGKTEIPSLQLEIYENIPVPDLPVIFPHKKLSFRILDTVRLDVASILGLLAYAINYKFEDVLSSPSAFLLDTIAVSALIFFVTRVALGYKQTWDRYELLVNRTLYEKTLASGFGAVHFLLDASEQQQYKECILAYAILLRAQNDQLPSRKSLGEECERFLYSKFKEKVQMPVDKAVDMLIKFGLVLEKTTNGEIVLQTVPCPLAYDALRKRWECLLH